MRPPSPRPYRGLFCIRKERPILSRNDIFGRLHTIRHALEAAETQVECRPDSIVFLPEDIDAAETALEELYEHYGFEWDWLNPRVPPLD